MPRGLSNWTYADLIEFLKDHGFEFLENRKGSHEAWVNRQTMAVVDVNFHGSTSFVPLTLQTMIRQSKIDKKEWRRWVSS